ncbi:LysR family transcriptional regulator [Streptomyces sp. 549]|uniref:LysR family transcriptional regulator n=1 Tax=Streptomyces sp. 549 TaxID=3049076 RepID=UPI0024C2F96E|nr:LysR family transcriptional regulator [Streptomyces sp. 549]MDK1474615.1 LysR family transcriptional regulator [Streptomyces sp. 549]
MDLVGACRAFVSVSERGSFTVGAAAAGMSQPVASRRVAALEERFGEPLFERTSRRAVLTPFGRDMLTAARRLVTAADVLQHEAETARQKPWRLAMPGICATADLARLVADARRHGVNLDLSVVTAPAERVHLLHSQQVRAALLAVPPDEATWSLPLGLAGTRVPDGRRFFVETLRPRRGGTGRPRRIWLQPEDDVPHIRDPLTRLRDAVGLRPAQLTVAADLTTAVAEVLCSSDVLLCSAGQAEELGLHWRPLGETTLTRGFALVAAANGNAGLLRSRLGPALARCLGHPDRTSPGRTRRRPADRAGTASEDERGTR